MTREENEIKLLTTYQNLRAWWEKKAADYPWMDDVPSFLIDVDFKVSSVEALIDEFAISMVYGCRPWSLTELSDKNASDVMASVDLSFYEEWRKTHPAKWWKDYLEEVFKKANAYAMKNHAD